MSDYAQVKLVIRGVTRTNGKMIPMFPMESHTVANYRNYLRMSLFLGREATVLNCSFPTKALAIGKPGDDSPVILRLVGDVSQHTLI